MVHSSSASPMKTAPSSSPLFAAPAKAPALASPSGGSKNKYRKQAVTKLLTTDFTSNAQSIQPSTQTPADADPPVGIPAKGLSRNLNPASAVSSALTQTSTQGPVNGRTSGRKRTPKACDCCGPNSKGHTPNDYGGGRGRGRGRGTSRDLGATPKRKVGQLTGIKNFDLSNKKVKKAQDKNATHGNTRLVIQNPASLPVTGSLQNKPARNCVIPPKGVKQKDNVQVGVSVAAGKGRGKSKDGDVRVSGRRGRGASVARGRGRGVKRPTVASKSKDRGGVAISSKKEARPQSGSGRGQEKQMHHADQTDPRSLKCPMRNGETVDLSDTEEMLEEDMIDSESGKAQLSASQLLRSGTPQGPNSEMQVEETNSTADEVFLNLTLSNGNNHSSTPMAVDLAANHCPVSLSCMQYSQALADHWLYCQVGTWDKDETEKLWHESQCGDKEKDEEMKSKEVLEQLTDSIHDFLESFYMKYGSFIPLSESDVLEHLKKEGISNKSKSLDIKGEMTRYRAGLASIPIAGFMVTYNRHTLSLEDLGTLEEQNWLNDQIINMYGELIMDATEHKVHFFNSFFHRQLVDKGYDGVKRWTKKVDLFSKWLLLIPIHLEIHWSLVTVTMATKTISYYDSQGIVFRHTTENILKYLQSEAKERKQTTFQKGWKTNIIKGIPQQKNDSDCGAFVLEYCRRLSMKSPLLFTQDDMPHIRKRIYKELCDCRLNN
ncbi:uncharacterized protein KZ484_006240 isoform 2-T3 [Pholidichthys leucotaenia]